MTNPRIVGEKRAVDFILARLSRAPVVDIEFKRMLKSFPWPDDTEVVISFRATVDGDDPKYEAFQALFEAVE
jgi:hypothetical protein